MQCQIGKVEPRLAYPRLAEAEPASQWNRQGLAEAYSALGDAYLQLARSSHLSRSAQLSHWRMARTSYIYQVSLKTMSDLQTRSAIKVEHGENLAKLDMQNIVARDAAMKNLQRSE